MSEDTGTDSLREALSASYDKIESAEGTDTPSGAPPPSAPTSPAPDAAAQPPSAPSPSAPGQQSAARPRSDVPPSQQPAQGGQPGTTVPPTVPGAGAEPQLRAPNAWRAEVREKWKDVPADIQGEIIKREREIRQSLQESADARKQVEAFQRTAAPYQHYIALEGGDPMAAFGDYLKTVAVLRGGTPHEKAWGLASVVQKFGVDVVALDQALTQMMAGGQGPTNGGRQQQQSQAEYRDPRVDTLLSRMEQQEAAREAALDAKAGEDVEAFYNDASHEFIDDVKNDMADILDLYANQNRKITLQEAYDRACVLHPEISKVLDQRKLAGVAQQQSGATARRRAAAGGISDSSGAATANSSNKAPTVKEAILAAMNQQA